MSDLTLGHWLTAIRLKRYTHIDNPSAEAAILAADALNLSREYIFAHPEHPISRQQRNQLDALWQQREAGAPLPYLLGWWDFFGRRFQVTPDVLIPRPETEEMVSMALDWLKDHPEAALAADVGTGSGCIAVSLALGCPRLRVHALEISPPAVKIARKNARCHAVSHKVRCIQSDLLAETRTVYPLILANLPYIPGSVLEGLDVARQEPRLALDGGADGLAVIERLLVQSRHSLAAGGLMILEIEETTGPRALERAKNLLPGAGVSLRKDLAGKDRFILVRREECPPAPMPRRSLPG